MVGNTPHEPITASQVQVATAWSSSSQNLHPGTVLGEVFTVLPSGTISSSFDESMETEEDALKMKSLPDKVWSWPKFVGLLTFLTEILFMCDSQSLRRYFSTALKFTVKARMPH